MTAPGDFNLKPSVDIASIASLMQKKAMAEQEQKNFERQQRLKEIEAAVSIGSTFAKGAVAASKMRQAREFADSVADRYKTPAQTVVVGESMEESRVPAPGPVADYTSKIPPAAGMPSIPVAESVTQTEEIPAQDNDTSNAIRKAAMVDPAGVAGQYADMLMPNPALAAMGGGMGGPIPVINQKTGQRAFVQGSKTGEYQLSTGEEFTGDWIRDYAPAIMRDQFDNPTIFSKTPGGGSYSYGGNDTGQGEKGIAGLQRAAPKLAERFVSAHGDAFPEKNEALKVQVEAAASAAAVEAILASGGQVGLQSLGFHLARMSGSNSQLSDPERATFERGLSLIRRITDKGYKLVAGDLSPEMRKDLRGLAKILEKRSRSQGQRYILSAKRRAASQVGDRRFKQFDLDTEFPTIDELVTNAGDMGEPAGGDIQVDQSALDAELKRRGL